jgi:hypothetical protein
MSRFWERIVRVTPPFEGTAEELKKNVESHSWRNVDLSIRFGVKDMGEVIECARCGVLAASNVAYYPCDDVRNGSIPKEVSWEEYKSKIK